MATNKNDKSEDPLEDYNPGEDDYNLVDSGGKILLPELRNRRQSDSYGADFANPNENDDHLAGNDQGRPPRPAEREYAGPGANTGQQRRPSNQQPQRNDQSMDYGLGSNRGGGQNDTLPLDDSNHDIQPGGFQSGHNQLHDVSGDSKFHHSAISRSRMRDDLFLSPNQSVLSGPGKGRRNMNDSALNAPALEDAELSQILNPNIERIMNYPPMLQEHPSTKKSNVFLKRNFMAVESLMNRMKRKYLREAWKELKSADKKEQAISDLKRKIDQKKKRREGIKRLANLAHIYRKQCITRALDRWSDALNRFREEEADKMRLAQVFTVMMGYKAKELQRIAVQKLKNLETILAKEAEERRTRDQGREIIRARKERSARILLELLRRLYQLRLKDGLYRITQEAWSPYGGSRRNNQYHKAAALMLMNHLITREIDRKRQEGLDAVKDYNDYLTQNPKKRDILDGLKKLAKLCPRIQRRIHGEHMFSFMKIKYNKLIRGGFSRMFEALIRAERRTKNFCFRRIFAQNIGLLKYQKLCTYFSGLFGKLYSSNRRRHLVESFAEIHKVAMRDKLRRKNARALVSKLQRIVVSLKADVFRKIQLVPAVQELFNFERDKYERSVRLRGALKIGNSFANYYRKFLFERVRKVFGTLRRFNHRFKVPAYFQRLDNFRYVWDNRRKDQLQKAFERLKGRSTLYLLQRYFRDTVDLSEGLNQDLIFALENGVPSNSEKTNQIIEFWNTTYDFEEAPVEFV